MKTIAVSVCVFIALLIPPLSTFGRGVSERSKVVEELLSAEYHDLVVQFTIFGEASVEKTTLYIRWAGRQNTIETPSGQHNHHADIESASGVIVLENVHLEDEDLVIPTIVAVVDIGSGSMNEHRREGKQSVDVFFKARSVEVTLLPSEETFSLGKSMIKIKDNEVRFLRSEALRAPSKTVTCLTTFGRIKSE
jgi:hypothetical protein